MSALDPVILNEVKLTQKAIEGLASSSSSGAVGQIVRLPTDATMPSDGSAVYLRSGILTSGEEYPDYPSWLPRYGGITWTQRVLPASTTWLSVTYGNGLFAAVAQNSAIAATSPDGITWTQRVLPASTNWYSVTYGNGVFVAVAYNSAIAATSPDGITWTQRAMPVSGYWGSVTYGNGVFVAVAQNSAIAATSPAGLIGIETYTKNEYLRVK